MSAHIPHKRTTPTQPQAEEPTVEVFATESCGERVGVEVGGNSFYYRRDVETIASKLVLRFIHLHNAKCGQVVTSGHVWGRVGACVIMCYHGENDEGQKVWQRMTALGAK